jgi:hypothetical protein
LVLLLPPTPLQAQGAYQPFGVDAKVMFSSVCNHSIGCPEIDLAAAAGAQWIRMFAVWNFIEVDLPPKMRQPVKSQNSANGEFGCGRARLR